MVENDNIIPTQQTGKAIKANAVVSLNSVQEARELFLEARSRLLDINAWHQIANGISAEFKLMDGNGQVLSRAPQPGDFFRIDIPGPGTKAGEGYDWVQIEEVISPIGADEEGYGFTVRPSHNPLKQTDEVAHFYSAESTSTFLIKRRKNVVSAHVYDRNTKANDNSNQTGDTIRDTVVAVAGLMGFSKIQWEGLVNGLIERR